MALSMAMLDAITPDNGPMQVVPGSHRGPVFDHHADGFFCGAIDALTPGLQLDTARPCLGNAGDITIHHVRAVHGSAPDIAGEGVANPIGSIWAGAMMLEQNDEWSLNRRYMQLEGLQTLSDTLPTRLAAVAR